MELFLIVISYTALAVAYWRGMSAVALLCGLTERRTFTAPLKKSPVKIACSSVLDILFMRRLLRVNRTLWFGEWVFHAAFILVILGHVRYIVKPVPDFTVHLNCIGKHAGYILPPALVYIVLVRLAGNEKGDYFSRRNLLLLSVIFSLGITGVLMRFFLRPDIVNIKHYVLGILALSPNPLPAEPLFIVHYVLFLVLLLYLPSHILAAPLIMIEARKREEAFVPLGHEE